LAGHGAERLEVPYASDLGETDQDLEEIRDQAVGTIPVVDRHEGH
jgi:hypothetical protein